MRDLLERRLKERKIILAPGIYDALTATIATDAGAEVLYLSGAGIAYTRLGRPDIGLVTLSEVVDTAMLVRDRVSTPLIVDVDTGYGNALNVERTVRLIERAGASGLQLEDQIFPKRCGHLSEKRLVPATEMVGKIKAASDARTKRDTLIIARTDAIAVEGLAAALDRAEAYREAGADVLFVEAPGSREELAHISDLIGKNIPLMANMVEGGRTPLLSATELEEMGFALVIFPGGVVRNLAFAARAYYERLLMDGTTALQRDRMLDFDALNQLLGTRELLRRGKHFESGS